MSEEFDQIKLAFQAHMRLVGVDIDAGDAGVRKCVTGAIERKRDQEVVAMLGKAATKASMLNEDFAALGLVANKSLVTVDGIQFRVLTVTTDPTDPMTDFLLVAEH